jgi:TolB-like protein/Flp pilus assembly protein TadD
MVWGLRVSVASEAIGLELDRILVSQVFRTSQRSQALLRYLVEKSLQNAVPKEYQIAVEVFGCRPDYNPAVDATVRVEAGRLRGRLREYYGTEGIADPIVIEIPKGGYAAVFLPSEAGAQALGTAQTGSFSEVEAPEKALELVAAKTGKTNPDAATPHGDPEPASESGEAERSMATARRKAWAVLAVAIAMLVVVGSWWTSHRVHRSGPIRSLAVLPLVNLSGSPDQEYFADGMTDELITELARIPNLEVVSRTSVMEYKGSKKPLRQIAHELGVDAIVEGSVTRSGDRVRITAQLIDARNDRHLWAQSFEGEMGDPLTLQDKVAREIAGQTKAALIPARNSGGGSPHVEAAAYDAYLRGLYCLHLREAHKSAAYFEQAVTLDSSYAAAYAGLASALNSESIVGEPTEADTESKALVAAQRAIQLDPGSGEAYTALGFIQLRNQNWAAAGQDLEKGLALSPNYSLAEMGYSVYLDAMGRPEEAVAHMRRGLKLDPLSFFMNRHLGSVLLMARHYDEALVYLNRAVEMEPTRSNFVIDWVSRAYEGSGRIAQAERSDLQNLAFTHSQEKLTPLRRAYQDHGWKAYQSARIKLLTANADDGCEFYEVGESYLRLGDNDKAISWINRAIDKGCFWTDWLRVDPVLDRLRADPRFPELLHRKNL